MLLGYEALRNLPLAPRTVRTPLADAPGHELAVSVGLVPILRAGLGMVDAFLKLVPSAEVWHLGLYRDEETLKPVEYYNRLSPRHAAERRRGSVLDSARSDAGDGRLGHRGDRRATSERAPAADLRRADRGAGGHQGASRAAHPDVDIYVGAVDSHLNEHGYIVPGLGDAGDRQFGT